MRRVRGLLLRLALARMLALVVGLLLLASAILIAVGDYGWKNWITDGLGLIGGSTGVALVISSFTGRRPDWIDPGDSIGC